MTETTPKPAGGPLARKAAMLCQAEGFHRYLDQARRARHGIDTNVLPDGTHKEEDAVDFIRTACGVESRADIDHEPRAAHMLRRIITNYRRWQSNQVRASS